MSRIAPGTRFGPYEVVSFLAAGGMGEVYVAHDDRLGRTVAIKILPQELFGDAEAVTRFEREARAAAAVSHPNLISIYDVGREGRIHYLVMDLLEGETLRERLRFGAMPWPKVVEIGAAIAAGLTAVHAKGFVHRDLKPDNVFLTNDGWVKLLDFGLALPKMAVSDDDQTGRVLTIPGMLVGTIAYMAPEQLRGEIADNRTDLFALGCVLAEMLTGTTVFRQPSHAETIAAILGTDEIPLPAIPASLAVIVRRCLERPRERRYASAEEVGVALRAVAGGSGAAMPAPTTSDASIAVLPFANLGGDAENDYFSEGLAEEILTSLTRVPGLKVTARTSAFAFRGKDQDIRRIGEALGVRTILEGTVRRAPNRVRVTTQLIDAASGYQLWSERYDAAMNDVLEVQDEIAAKIVETLHLKLVSPGRAAVPHTSNVDAWHAYLKSRYHFGRLTPERLALSRACAEQAIELDPNFAAAHAMLAECFLQTAVYGLQPADEMVPLARAAASQAVVLDESAASGHMTLARIAGECDRDWNEALRRCRIALGCERISPAMRALCAQYILWPLRRFDEMDAVIQPALTADPLSPMPRMMLALALYARGERARGIEEVRAIVELHDHFWPGYLALGQAYSIAGDTAAAIEFLEKGLAVSPWNASGIGLLAGNLMRAGEGSRAARLLERLDVPQFDLLRPLGFAAFHLVAGDFDRAADGMAAMLDAHYPVAAFYTAWLLYFDEFRQSEGGRRVRDLAGLS